MTPPPPQILIVDDEPDILELLSLALRREGLTVRQADTLASAHRQLEQGGVNLCLTDLKLPDGNGIELVRHIAGQFPGVPVAVITAHGNMEAAVEAMKAGAFDFVSKPLDLKVLRFLVQTALRLPTPAGSTTPDTPLLLGDSPPMQEIRRLIGKLARNQAPVYISGESGTGKELAARSIHTLGPRAGGEFVAVNCGAIPAELIESELFGHKKGSFTGAVADKEGLFQTAHGGTLFLDEVADLPFLLQVKLLRVIQQKAVRPVGGAREIPVDVRIISATHQSLAALVEAGQFRQDLYYRINVIELHLPPLRERHEDVAPLVAHFLGRFRESLHSPGLGIDPEALLALTRHPLPGNVRELENILERAVTLCEGGRITLADIPPPRFESLIEQPLEEYLEAIEKKAILEALEATRWNRTAAAKRLGMSFRQMRYRLAKLGLEV